VKKVLIAVSAVVAIGGLAGPAAAKPDLPVTVTQDNGGVQVRSGIPNQPLFSVSADNNGVCTGFSYEMGQCVGIVKN
jgi:hypothetical protein